MRAFTILTLIIGLMITASYTQAAIYGVPEDHDGHHYYVSGLYQVDETLQEDFQYGISPLEASLCAGVVTFFPSFPASILQKIESHAAVWVTSSDKPCEAYTVGDPLEKRLTLRFPLGSDDAGSYLMHRNRMVGFLYRDRQLTTLCTGNYMCTLVYDGDSLKIRLD